MEVGFCHTHALTQSWGWTKNKLGATVWHRFGVMWRSPARMTTRGGGMMGWDGTGLRQTTGRLQKRHIQFPPYNFATGGEIMLVGNSKCMYEWLRGSRENKKVYLWLEEKGSDLEKASSSSAGALNPIRTTCGGPSTKGQQGAITSFFWQGKAGHLHGVYWCLLQATALSLACVPSGPPCWAFSALILERGQVSMCNLLHLWSPMGMSHHADLRSLHLGDTGLYGSSSYSKMDIDQLSCKGHW